MSPARLRIHHARIRFPRVSGDEPRLTNETQVTLLFSPRERG